MEDQLRARGGDAAAKPESVAETKIELERQFTAFALLWSLASILTAWARFELAVSDPIIGATHILMGLLAFAVLIRSRAVAPVVGLAFMHMLHGVLQMPHVTATDVLWMFLGAAICVSFLTGWIARRSYSVGRVGLYRSFAPCLRIIFVLSLIAIPVARLNWTFLQLEVSPVVESLAAFRGDGTQPPLWISYFTISMLIVIDVFVAIALLLPRLRRFAVGFGACYFAWQAAMGLGEARFLLPVIIVGLYLFTSSELIGRVHATLVRIVPFASLRASGLTVFVGAMAILIVALLVAGEAYRANAYVIAEGCYIVLVVGWLGLILSSLVELRPKLTWVSLMMRNPLHYLLIAAFIVAVTSPYLGFGSKGKFVGGSGLSTAGGVSNHLVIPQGNIVNHEKDVVKIVESNDPWLQKIADEALLITWFELVNHVGSRPETSLAFMRANELYEVSRTGDVPELSQENSWILRKLLTYELTIKKSPDMNLTGNKMTAEKSEPTLNEVF